MEVLAARTPAATASRSIVASPISPSSPISSIVLDGAPHSLVSPPDPYFLESRSHVFIDNLFARQAAPLLSSLPAASTSAQQSSSAVPTISTPAQAGDTPTGSVPPSSAIPSSSQQQSSSVFSSWRIPASSSPTLSSSSSTLVTSTTSGLGSVQTLYAPSSTTTSTTTPIPTNRDNDSNGLTTGASVGIGVGIGIAALIAALVSYILWRRRWGKKQIDQSFVDRHIADVKGSDGIYLGSAELEGHDSRVEVPARHGQSEMHAEPELLSLARPSMRDNPRKYPTRQPYAGLTTQHKAPTADASEVDAPADEGTMSSTTAPTGQASEFGDAVVAIEHLEAEREKVRQQKQRLLREELQELEMREHDLEQQIAKQQRGGRRDV